MNCLKNLFFLLFISTGTLAVAQGEKKSYYYPDGKVRCEVNVYNGNYVGEWMFYYESGIKLKKGYFKNSVPDSLWIFWDEEGRLQQMGNCKGDLLEGLWVYYYPNGNRKSEEHYNAN